MREEYTRNCFAEILGCVQMLCRDSVYGTTTFAVNFSQLFVYIVTANCENERKATDDGRRALDFRPPFCPGAHRHWRRLSPDMYAKNGTNVNPLCVYTWRHFKPNDPRLVQVRLRTVGKSWRRAGMASWPIRFLPRLPSRIMPMFFRVHVTWNRCATHGIDVNNVLRPKANEGFINYTTDYY